MSVKNYSIQTILPEGGYVRLSQLVGNPKAEPPIPGIIPAGRSTIWLWIKQGKFPKPLKLGPRVTVFSVESILEFLEKLEAESRAAK